MARKGCARLVRCERIGLDGHGRVDYEGLGKTDGECGGFGDFAWEWAGEYGGVVGLASNERGERGVEELSCLCWRLAVCLFALLPFGSLHPFILLRISFCIAFFSSSCFPFLHSHGSDSLLSDDNNDYDTTTYERYNDTINDIKNGW